MTAAEREQIERDLDQRYPEHSRAHYAAELAGIRRLRADIAAAIIRTGAASY